MRICAGVLAVTLLVTGSTMALATASVPAVSASHPASRSASAPLSEAQVRVLLESQGYKEVQLFALKPVVAPNGRQTVKMGPTASPAGWSGSAVRNNSLETFRVDTTGKVTPI